MPEFQSEQEIKEEYRKALKRSQRVIVIFLMVVICLFLQLVMSYTIFSV